MSAEEKSKVLTATFVIEEQAGSADTRIWIRSITAHGAELGFCIICVPAMLLS